ncbi:TIGR03364 family FAD-dependent oxidoreductase [Curtobacterium sp. MCBA15_008]|uniref:TIGR03364 family FAD-dependent oxidoreductase n=1 Tax=Curtobacterium sp. MCBA15_008 TaxID=1898736 RepID=UPI0008DE912C|nr:TIGR03364 family FAD-dependent oxidoreductase [Curtobacterium sp. MCBA15_008]OII05446.1 oxidoreductase [Curtobacterium sp. MCBA15_008]
MSTTNTSAQGAGAEHVDVLVVGAGIVGLGIAYEAMLRGARVAVVDRAAGVVGASVRNFGHACITPQTGDAAEYAQEARRRWTTLAPLAGFVARERGAHVVARRPEELAVLEEYRSAGADLRLLDAAGIADAVPVDASSAIGGAHLARDLQVDPREAAPAIAAWLATQGVRFHWRTAALGIETGAVRTARGDISADRIVVCTNHDVDQLFPELAERAGVVRCRLHMLRAAIPLTFPLATPLLTGWSLLRYSGFAGTPSAPALRTALAAALPEGIRWDLNQMYTSPSDGSVIVGDTHERDVDAPPFQSEDGFRLLLTETERLFGAPVRVLDRWQGVYASSPRQEFLLERPLPGVDVVTVTTGIGMTTGLGLAPAVLDAA